MRSFVGFILVTTSFSFVSCASSSTAITRLERNEIVIKIVDPHRPTSNQEIDLFEKDLNIKLPTEYRNWLLKFNGGSPRPRVFEFRLDGEEASSCVAWFYAIDEGRINNLRKTIEVFKLNDVRMPVDLLPIACDPGGNQICLGYQGDNLGKVFFWDHEQECGGEYDNCYLIANSFNEFLANLKD